MTKIERPHPLAGATYRIVGLAAGDCAVEVTIPDAFPTMITGLGGEEAAKAWIENHKQEVLTYPTLRRMWKRT